MKFKNVLGMLILVVLCAGIFFFARGSDETESRGPANLLGAFDKDDVLELEAAWDENELHVRRKPGDSSRFQVRVNDDFVRADATLVEEILGSIQRADVQRLIPLAEANVKEYGLDEPSLGVTLTLPGSDVRSARFGSNTREGNFVYADGGAGTDVMVVPSTPSQQLFAAFGGALRDRQLIDMRAFDVKTIRITRGGAVTLAAEKDRATIWHISEPFTGYGEPKAFETRIGQIVAERWQGIFTDDVEHLRPEWGFTPPLATITLTGKRDREVVALLGRDEETGKYIAMERDGQSIYVVSQRFVDAVLADAADVRDRSFSRLGNDGKAVVVKIDGQEYTLEKGHDGWDIRKPVIEPGHGEAIRRALDLIRQWHVVEFLDGAKPEDHGIDEDGDLIAVQRNGGGEVLLRMGDDAGDGRIYAQRVPDGGVVIVSSDPRDAFAGGWLKFRRLRLKERFVSEISHIGMTPGFGEWGKQVEEQKWTRDVEAAESVWRPGLGITGSLDREAMNRFLATLQSTPVVRWVHYESRLATQLGFQEDGSGAATLWLSIGTGPDVDEEILYIGKPAGDEGFYARLSSAPHYAFILAPDIVTTLTHTLVKR